MMREHITALRMQYFPWEVPLKIRRFLGHVGMFYMMLLIYSFGVAMGRDIMTLKLWASLLFNVALCYALIIQMPSKKQMELKSNGN